MIQCPNCGGTVKFDIPSQKMKCESCGSDFEPYAFQFGNGAEESTEYDVTVFKCPQCGGEIISTDETAAGFCSYCGSSNVLLSRISKERRPELIIPFKKSKKECKDIFLKRMKKAFFAPKGYINESSINSFRGIYMPYWLYDMSQQGNIQVRTSTSHRSGDYIITDHYVCSGYLDNVYNGLSYDASSSFADDISESIAPFDVKGITTFTPSFLAGYYADVADVPAETYRGKAMEFAQDSTYNYLAHKSPMSRETFEDTKETITRGMNTRLNVQRSAMFPVWFMSYRNKNRIAYATVNGQTGKIAADVPVSVPKFFACSAVLAVVIAILLQIFLTVTPKILLVIIAILSVISVCLYNGEMKKIVSIENHENDIGLQTKKQMKQQQNMQSTTNPSSTAGNAGSNGNSNIQFVANAQKTKKQGSKVGKIIIIFVFAMFFLPFIIGGAALVGEIIGGSGVRCAILVLALIISIVCTVSSGKQIKQMIYKNGAPASLWSAIAIGIMLVVTFLNPVSDMYYYAAALVAMAGVILNLVDLILCYNLIAMRPLPQFDLYKGGDDRA